MRLGGSCPFGDCAPCRDAGSFGFHFNVVTITQKGANKVRTKMALKSLEALPCIHYSPPNTIACDGIDVSTEHYNGHTPGNV